MRVIQVATLSLLFPTAALAKKAPPPAETPTESANARAARLALAEDTGSTRAGELKTGLAVTSVQTGASSEHAPVAAQEPARSAAPLSGALEELVAKQQRRNEAAFDRCLADARARNPAASGDVELAVHLVGKKASVEVVHGAVDAAFGACVSQTASALKMSLPDITFAWHLTLGTPSPAGTARAALP